VYIRQALLQKRATIKRVMFFGNIRTRRVEVPAHNFFFFAKTGNFFSGLVQKKSNLIFEHSIVSILLTNFVFTRRQDAGITILLSCQTIKTASQFL
jgi:hypothetical protein